MATTKLYVGNLAEGTRNSDIEPLFAKHGQVAECDVIKNYAFVHMADEGDAHKAIAALNNSEVNGSRISVEVSKSKVRRTPGMGGSRNGCFRCGKPGHWSKDCYKNMGGDGRGGGSFGGGAGGMPLGRGTVIREYVREYPRGVEYVYRREVIPAGGAGAPYGGDPYVESYPGGDLYERRPTMTAIYDDDYYPDRRSSSAAVYAAPTRRAVDYVTYRRSPGPPRGYTDYRDPRGGGSRYRDVGGARGREKARSRSRSRSRDKSYDKDRYEEREYDASNRRGYPRTPPSPSSPGRDTARRYK